MWMADVQCLFDDLQQAEPSQSSLEACWAGWIATAE
jgi:hypothetical protein